MSHSKRSIVFDYRALRLIMGLIAFSLPIVVTVLATDPLSSISASYYTDGRDAFVGMLFIVGALLWAYHGHNSREEWASKIASVAAISVAVFPTACAACSPDTTSIIHYVAASTLFSLLAYFCLGPFRKNTKDHSGKKGRRGRIYLICGLVIIGAMLGLLASTFLLPQATQDALLVTYFAEAVALWAFGVAWMVAGKYFSVVVDEDEALQLFEKR